jgi:hypothetical protein
MKTKMMLTAMVALSLNACGVKEPASTSKDIGMMSDSAHPIAVWLEHGLVFSKECSRTETVVTRECASTVEPRVTSYAGFFKTLALKQGVAAGYADFRGPERVARDRAAIEKALASPGQTPQELAYAEDRLNQLNDVSFRLGKVQRLISYLQSGHDIVYAKGVHAMFDALDAALKGQLSVWQDRVNLRYWTRLDQSMNWFDAMELPRVVDQYGEPSDAAQEGCVRQLGEGWRVPTLAETQSSYQAGLKRMPGIGLANPFWVADEVGGEVFDSAKVFSVNGGISQARPKSQQVFTVCVRSIGS